MVEGNQNVEARKIGIYQGQVWHTDMAIKAEFDVARLHELNRPNITLGKPFIVVGVGDARGISAVKAPQVNGEMLTVEPGPAYRKVERAFISRYRTVSGRRAT